MHSIEALNQAIFLQVNASADTAAWAIDLAIVIGNDLIFTIPLLLLGIWLWGDNDKRSAALKSCAVAFIALGLNQLIGLFWQHPRPFDMGLGHTFLAHVADSSFPSDHGTVFASIAFTLLFSGLPLLGAITLLAGCAVAWARVFLGVHFPLDMVGAVMVSVVTYAIVNLAWTKIGDGITYRIASLYRKVFAWPISSGWIKR